MSMKPGATMRPRASIVRAASPARLGPIAAIRSPSTATSASAAGAPLPSTTVPFLIRSDQAIPLLRGLDDLHRLHLVALLDLVDHVHARHDLAEHGVLAVEEIRGRERDVELAACRIGIAGPRHRHGAAHVGLLVELRLDLVAGTAGAGAVGIPALDDEARLHPVEGETVVEALLRQRDEVLYRLGRVVGEELDDDLAAVGHRDDRFLFHLLASLGCGLLSQGRAHDQGAGEQGDHERRDEWMAESHGCLLLEASANRPGHYALPSRAHQGECGGTAPTCLGNEQTD